jgi:competence CoiA-like predicted nuclease
MPNLKPETLEKRHQCPYCGETLRTRQGLSGHIQFKHKKEFKIKKRRYGLTNMEINLHKITFTNTGFSDAELDTYLQVYKDWNRVKPIIENQKVNINENDYKNFLIAWYTQSIINTRLKKQLAKEIYVAVKQINDVNVSAFDKILNILEKTL